MQVLRKPDAIALTEAFSRRGAPPSLRSGVGQGVTGGAPAAPAAASAAASVGQVSEASLLAATSTEHGYMRIVARSVSV